MKMKKNVKSRTVSEVSLRFSLSNVLVLLTMIVVQLWKVSGHHVTTQ